MRYYLKDGTTRTIEADRVYRDGDHIVFATVGRPSAGICGRVPLALATGQVDLDASSPVEEDLSPGRPSEKNMPEISTGSAGVAPDTQPPEDGPDLGTTRPGPSDGDVSVDPTEFRS